MYEEWSTSSKRMTLHDGFNGGLVFAALISCVAVLRFALAMFGIALFSRSSLTHDGVSAGKLLLLVIPGYFVGFSLAGILLAATSHLSNRVLRYGLSGFFCGSSIYGAMGISASLSGSKLSDMREGATFGLVVGTVCGVIGIVLGVLDSWRERKA
jgi:hypothetical protein